MLRFLKTFLVVFLALALPLQGFAAAMKMPCAPGHHVAEEAVQAMADVHDHNYDDGAVQHHAHHAMYDHASADHAFSIDKAGDNHADSHKHKNASCSVCAACGFGAVAPPGAQVRPPAFVAALRGFLPPADLLTGFIPGGLERPPRASLA